MKPLVIASRNPSKALQAQVFFRASGFRVETQAQAGVEGGATEDRNGIHVLEVNSLKKVEYAALRLHGRYIFADDTGLFIEALNGHPGAQAAEWGGPEMNTEGRMLYCLREMQGIADRRATFKTVVTLITPERRIHIFKGTVRGVILTEPRCAPQPMMPYSPIFQPEGEDRVWAEMPTEYENEISHRGKAFKQLEQYLKEEMQGAAAR